MKHSQKQPRDQPCSIDLQQERDLKNDLQYYLPFSRSVMGVMAYLRRLIFDKSSYINDGFHNSCIFSLRHWRLCHSFLFFFYIYNFAHVAWNFSMVSCRYFEVYDFLFSLFCLFVCLFLYELLRSWDIELRKKLVESWENPQMFVIYAKLWRMAS